MTSHIMCFFFVWLIGVAFTFCIIWSISSDASATTSDKFRLSILIAVFWPIFWLIRLMFELWDAFKIKHKQVV